MTLHHLQALSFPYAPTLLPNTFNRGLLNSSSPFQLLAHLRFGFFLFFVSFCLPRAWWPLPRLLADLSPSSVSLRDPDSVVLCLLAIDEEEEDDIALQIHFTLIQSFCCDNDINIVRVSGMQRLAQLLGEPAETQDTTEARDLHCLLVTVS